MAYQGYSRQYPTWSYQQSTGRSEQDLEEYSNLAGHEYSGYPDSAFHSPSQGHDQTQQRQTYLGTSWTPSGTSLGHLQGDPYSNQDMDRQWELGMASYPEATVPVADDYRNFYRDPSRSGQGHFPRFPPQDTHSAAQPYTTGPTMATGAQDWRQAQAGTRMTHMGYNSAPQASIAYSQYPQAPQGTHSHSSQAPTLRIDAAEDSGYAHLSRSRSSGGIEEDSFTFSAAASPLLSPFSQMKGEDEQSSGSSPTPDPQAPPSPSVPSGSGDPSRKWKCKLPECAARKGFKRHADLMRHMTTVHHNENMEKFSCPRRGCPRKGSNGFTRKDHLTEHLRNFHVQDIPKRKGGRGKSRE